MDEDGLLDLWRCEHQRPVKGWDFSELDGRHLEQQPPWSYDALARSALTGATSALDMGTGGGEVLCRLVDALPEDTVATEGWPPNLPAARKSLAPLGIEVVEYDAERDAAMPFDDGRFDVVLNRHEAYRAAEVLRILRPNGRFLTQQVDGRDFEETQEIFGGQSAWAHITLDNLRAEAVEAGFEIEEAQEWQGNATFADVATLVRYFAFVPWEVPEDFTVDRYAEQLLELHKAGRQLTFTQRRFYLLCRSK
ncbi:MAG TPA: class I SAM-dependent methyltransferase [Nocardioidaceae bacterium]|nr:class I SAM-dependent methyltransferase [Nocardioidaceae bacterium]